MIMISSEDPVQLEANCIEKKKKKQQENKFTAEVLAECFQF